MAIIHWIGIDDHADKLTIAHFVDGNAPVRVFEVVPDANGYRLLLKYLKSLNGEVRVAYEAGPCGFELYRRLRKAGIHCDVAAPSLTPVKPGQRVKTNRRDAEKIGRLYRAGELTLITVPDQKREAVRDVVRGREGVLKRVVALRNQIIKLLLRYGHVFDEPGETWSTRHLQWLSKARFDEPLSETVFGEYLAHHEVLLARRERLDTLISEQALVGSWAPTVARLRCLRGIDTLTAVGLVAEIGDITAFARPKQLASYLGLVPSEQSSGERRRQGSITKAGSSHARRLLIEAAWHYRRPPRVSLTLKRRQAGQPPAAIDAAWRAQNRLHRRWAHLDGARGKKRTTVAVAVARELACFVWEIAHQPD